MMLLHLIASPSPHPLPVEETGTGSETRCKHPFVHADGFVHSLSPRLRGEDGVRGSRRYLIQTVESVDQLAGRGEIGK